MSGAIGRSIREKKNPKKEQKKIQKNEEAKESGASLSPFPVNALIHHATSRTNNNNNNNGSSSTAPPTASVMKVRPGKMFFVFLFSFEKKKSYEISVKRK
jgi:hypothetical protein